VDLKILARRLNDEPAFRKQFFADPVQAFAAEGVVLPEKAQDALRRLARSASSRASAVPGSNLAPEGSMEGVTIARDIKMDLELPAS